MINKQEIERFGNLEFLAKQIVEGFITGLHKSPYHGFSVEFAEHRIYNEGESTRHIDWKLYARTEKLFIKRYEEETNLRCQIVIDTSSSMYYPKDEADNKMRFAVHCAAALIELFRRQRDAVGLTFFNEDIDLHTQAKSSIAHHRYLYAELEGLLLKEPAQKKTNVVASLHQIADSIHKRSLVILFSDMFSNVGETNQNELFEAVQHLRHNKHEVIVFHIVDGKSELQLDFENRPYVFVDMETNEEVKLNPIQIKEHFGTEMINFVKQLKIKLGQYNVDFVETDLAQGFENILLSYLLKSKKLY